jgi:uncharacterized protein YbaR (Trm112 family)
LDFVKHLIENKADINQKDNDGLTVLMYAARGGHLDVMKYLVENKADINKKCRFDYHTALEYAEKYGHADVVKHLVNRGMCGSCGRTSEQLLDHFEKIRNAGGVVISPSWAPADGFLYCNKCGRYFCGNCQIDLGFDSGCPRCKNPLVVK